MTPRAAACLAAVAGLDESERADVAGGIARRLGAEGRHRLDLDLAGDHLRQLGGQDVAPPPSESALAVAAQRWWAELERLARVEPAAAERLLQAMASTLAAHRPAMAASLSDRFGVPDPEAAAP